MNFFLTAGNLPKTQGVKNSLDSHSFLSSLCKWLILVGITAIQHRSSSLFLLIPLCTCFCCMCTWVCVLYQLSRQIIPTALYRPIFRMASGGVMWRQCVMCTCACSLAVCFFLLMVRALAWSASRCRSG